MKPRHSATLIKADGTTLETADHDIFIRDVSIPSVDVEPEFEEIPGSSVLIHVGNKVSRDTIEVEFDFRARDMEDYSLLRNEVFNLFHSEQPFYFLDPLEKGKRYYVMARGFRPDRIGTLGRSSVNLQPVRAYAESVGTTLSAYDEDAGLWGYGMGLPEGITSADFIKTAGTFDIYNYGNFEINPREHELLISLLSTGGTGSGIELRNLDTGDSWQFNGSFNSGDLLEIKGIHTTKNQFNANADTDLGLLRLKPGQNQFELTGIDGDIEIRFDFRFLYN